MNNIVTKENIIDFLNGNLSVQDTIDVLETMA